MRRILVISLLAMGGMSLGLPLALGQSGVISGPPQNGAGPGPQQYGGGPPPQQYGNRPGEGPNNLVGPPGVEPESRGTWIAIAGGFDGNGRNVAVGYSGHQNSKIDAEDAALRACNGYGRGVRCRSPVARSTGCLYIAPGSRNGGVTWGSGATRDVALNECRRGGYNCPSNKLVGGCVPGYGG